MIAKTKIAEFEKIIGYTFVNKNYLKQALSHSSYANEMRMSKLLNNERLEFLEMLYWNLCLVSLYLKITNRCTKGR